MPALKGRLQKESEQSFWAVKYKSYGSFFYIKHSKQSSEEISIKQWNGDTENERKYMCYDTEEKYETIQEVFFSLKGNMKQREKGDKDSSEQNALVPTLKCRIP